MYKSPWIKIASDGSNLPNEVDHDILFSVPNPYGKHLTMRGTFYPDYDDSNVTYKAHFEDEEGAIYLANYVTHYQIMTEPED